MGSRFRDRMVAAPLKRRRISREHVISRSGFRDRMVAAPLKRRSGLEVEQGTPRFRDRMVAAPLKPAARVALPSSLLQVSAIEWSRPH